MNRFAYYLPILEYHRVGPFKGDHVPTVSGELFERQVGWLAKGRRKVLSLAEVADLLDRGAPMPRRSVVMTFDDGYEETYRVAWPLLKRAGFPATVFVTPEEVGQPGFVSWEQLVELAAEGMEIGSHTLRHTYLPLAAGDRLWEEVAESKRVIEARLGRPIDAISYPVGGFTPDVLQAVERAGYRTACTTNRCASWNGTDRFALRRVKVTQRDTSPLVFLAKVSGYYDLFRQLKQPS